MKIVRKQSDLTIRFKKYQTLQQIYANRNRSVRQNGVFNIKRPCYNFTKRYIYICIYPFSRLVRKSYEALKRLHRHRIQRNSIFAKITATPLICLFEKSGSAARRNRIPRIFSPLTPSPSCVS